jgi:hypothetical protein
VARKRSFYESKLSSLIQVLGLNLTGLLQLKLNDGSDTVVAEYKCKSVGLISKARDPSLEIFPPFEHMIDEIMVRIASLSPLLC